MTNKEYRNKYPRGTKVRWTLATCFANHLAKKDVGKIGVIVGYDKRDCPFIFLPESEHKSSNSTQAAPISWWTSWRNVEILSQKGKQLLFAFMD